MTQTLPDRAHAAPPTTATTRRPYPGYRDSGVPWLGQIPAHWGVKRLKHVCRLRYGESLAAEGRVLGDIPVYGSNGVVGLHNSHNTVGPCLIVGRKGSYGKVAYSEGDCFVIDTAYSIDRQETNTDIRWLFYVLSCLNLDQISQDTGVPGLSREEAYNAMLPAPPFDEQRAIAAYLDRETARLDALVAAKQRLIGLLREKRAALISQAVTRGLDAGVALRESGVPWLGQIPAHWRVKRLKFVAELATGHTPSRSVPEYWENCTIPWVSLNDVGYLKDHDYIDQTTNLINELGLANSSARLLPTGTVILSRDATVGRCGILARPMATAQHFVNWICSSSLLPEYLLMVFRGPMQQEFERLTMGATIRTIGMPDVGSFVVPVPSVEEQRAIVAELSARRAQLDALIDSIERQIEKLREYRAAVIAAAVTGLFDVRESGSTEEVDG